MRRIFHFELIFILLFSAAAYGTSDGIPENLKLKGGLAVLRDRFYKTTDFVQQVILVKTIKKNVQKERYLLLEEIALWPIRLADKYGEVKNLSPEAWKIAIEALAESGNPRFTDTLTSIVKNASNPNIRIAAAKGLAQLKDPSSLKILISLVRHQYNYENFREDNEKMFQDDRVVQAIIEAMGEVGDPKIFTALLDVVTKRNHRQATIQAAWQAMEKLKW